MIVLRAFQRNQDLEISAHLTALRQEDKSIMLNLGSDCFSLKYLQTSAPMYVMCFQPKQQQWEEQRLFSWN